MSDARKMAEEALARWDRNTGAPRYERHSDAVDCVLALRALLDATAPAAGEREEGPKMPPNRIVHYGFFGITERDAPNECVVCSEAYGPCPDCDRKRANGKRQEACLHYEHGDGDCLDNACGVCTERYRAFVDSIHPKRRAVQPPHPALSFICTLCGGNGDFHGKPGDDRCAECGGNEGPRFKPPPPAQDAVREAAEEWAAAEAEYDAMPAHSRDTDAFERNLFRRQAARRRLLAVLDARPGGERGE